MKIRVLLADDHVMFREALRVLLQDAPGIEVVGEASDGAQMETLVERLAPDVVVVDVNMPTLDGIEATRRLTARYPQLRIVALSAHVSRRFVVEMLDAGALGYVSKFDAGEDLVRAIVSVMQGKRFLCPEAAVTLIEATQRVRRGGRGRENTRLGQREREILCLLAEGSTTPEIADALHIARSTVNVHRRNIMRKVELHSVAELTKYAIREGLVSA